MSSQISTGNHQALNEIMRRRGMTRIEPNTPFWKLKLTEEEYESLRQTLRCHSNELEYYGEEAALCYAEWWRRDYSGSIPSKEDVAEGIGLSRYIANDLFKSARAALRRHGYTFIHSQKGTEYFRTLLNQGGLPVTYIKRNDNGFGNFTRFLSGLVRELSTINYDWNSEDISIIEQFSCISYLGKAFRNDNIYDVAFQIAHAIIMEDNSLLPYDDTDRSLSELTTSLRKEYKRVKSEKRIRPLSLHWKMQIDERGEGYLLVNLDVVKDISSSSIQGLDYLNCYSFDVFVSGKLVGKYVRKELNRDNEGDVTGAIYSRISVGIVKDILWQGEPVVEVKVRCDNDERIFLTMAGSFPPNFETPQVFQLLDNNLYVKSQTANAEENIVVFTSDWHSDNSSGLVINGQDLSVSHFREFIDLENVVTGEELHITNEFTPYTVEFSGTYLPWVESANYKLIAKKMPTINVYGKEKERIPNAKSYYRAIGHGDNEWRKLSSSSFLPVGKIEIKVVFPDGHFEIESFYNIKDLEFKSQNEGVNSTEVKCSCDSTLCPEMEVYDDLNIEKQEQYVWRVSKKEGVKVCPTECRFHIYSTENPTLKLSIAIPFDGIQLTHVNGQSVRNHQVISLANLSHYRIVSHGYKNRSITISYTCENKDAISEIKPFKSKIISGIVPLSDYHDLIVRMFNLYGVNSFDRSSSVVLNVSDKQIYIRRFILECELEDDNIHIYNLTEKDTPEFIYEGSIYAVSVEEPISSESFHPTELIKDEENGNIYHFPEEFDDKEVIVFSGAEARRRITPKYFNRNINFQDKEMRASHSRDVIIEWATKLNQEDVIMGKSWQAMCTSFEVCSTHDLPFTTFNGFKAIRCNSEILAKFILAMWISGREAILTQSIEDFEQEIVTAIHWIPSSVWQKTINEMIDNAPEPLRIALSQKLCDFTEVLQELFSSTLSIDVAKEFATFIIAGNIGEGKMFSNYEMRQYRTKVHGISDLSSDLPVIKHNLRGHYYPYQQMQSYYRAMLESAMCAAENTCEVEGATNLFSEEFKENGRIINFYRRYFKETYSEIFLRTLKLIHNVER